MVNEIFEAIKGPTEIIDFVIGYDDLLDDNDPTDQISSSTWAVTRGELAIDNDWVEGTNYAVARVSGGTRYNTIHEILNTVDCVSGQRYTRTIRITVAKV